MTPTNHRIRCGWFPFRGPRLLHSLIPYRTDGKEESHLIATSNAQAPNLDLVFPFCLLPFANVQITGPMDPFETFPLVQLSLNPFGLSLRPFDFPSEGRRQLGAPV